jgi:uncharacterized protein YijF (DUF1287 family)
MNMTDAHKRMYALGLIQSAAKTLEKSIQDPHRLDSVTWRLADALGLIGESVNEYRNPGLDHPTGRGYLLTKRGAE